MEGGLRIVGIGASAGGVEALKGFFENMPADSGCGFVVVLHLSPNHPSMLAEVLGRWTKMPVVQATEKMTVEPNRVHVIVPGQVMTIENGCLSLHVPPDQARVIMPIDTFFSSLAKDKGPDCVGVVLSGTGTDGALGLKAIKARGGFAITQGSDGSGPQFDGMPSAAIATGVVDLVLPVEAMAERILHLQHRPDLEGEDDPRAAASDESCEAEAARIGSLRARICGTLKNHVGHDFSGYKQQTFMRRVQRRMVFLGLTLENYVEHLANSPHEVVLLFHDLLIGVTNFFRDPDTFAELERLVIPRLFDSKGPDGTVRVWVPGCATGEEAYSLGILLLEHAAKLSPARKIQIFATDIDEAAVNVARVGRYPALLLENVSPDLRKKYFLHVEDTYQVRKDLRDLCTFSTHSVIRDPPFSRMDLISCRNLLIYFDPDLQGRVIPAFHYSLVPGGILILGGSEMVTRHADLFIQLDKKHRIFQRRDMQSPPLQVVAAQLHSSVLPSLSRARQSLLPALPTAARIARERILERYAPAHVVVDNQSEVVYFSSRTGKYLEAATGTPTRNVIAMARSGLRSELRAALRSAIDSGRPVQRDNVPVDLDGAIQSVSLTIEPLPLHEPSPLFMIIFIDAAPPRARDAASAAVEPRPGDATIEQLERDLRDSREQLQASVEEYETTLEELKSANEELYSVNEELQSTNEELETSKEEIQSMNEELHTVNTQLSGKVDQLDHANTDLKNLFESTQVATVFLDRFLVVRGFTPAIAGIFNLIPSDVGRPLTDIVSQIDDQDLRTDVGRVLDSRELMERRVQRHDGSVHYLMRILPYRTRDNQIDGVLITFVDVSSMVRAEEHQRLLVDEINHRVRNMLTVVISIATQTLRKAKTLDEFSEGFLGRLNALSSAYTLLSRDNWTGVAMHDVIREEVAPYLTDGRENVQIEGPPILLRSRGAMAFGMVAHELATNAVKYGALSVPAGKVTLRWTVNQMPKI